MVHPSNRVYPLNSVWLSPFWRCFALMAFLVLSGCAQESGESSGSGEAALKTGQAQETSAAQPAPVTLHTLANQTWTGSIAAFGVVEALEEVNVAAELSGTVASVHINEGDRVQAGQLLLTLDARKRELAQQQVKQQVQQSRTALREARLKLNRRLDLAKKESISKEVLDSAQLAVDGASAAYQQAVATLQLAERELADTNILSPTDGLVDIKAVEVGEAVQAGSSLITLQADASLRVHTWVSEADIAHLRAGNAASVTTIGLPGRVFAAVVEWVGVNADAATGNFPVKLILTDPNQILRPGMTASVTIAGISVPNALLLPEAALIDRQRKRVVFVVEQGVARLREPLLAAGFSNRLQIIDGLVPGEQVVTAGQERLRDGTPVRIQVKQPDSANMGR
ncbi:MAG: efflux RND transporter periplasmic adaptor subunit [Halioglobus sp.]